MGEPYEPGKHIYRLQTAPRPETVYDQRDITVQTYQTTIPFDYQRLDEGLERAWLSPVNRLGGFLRSPFSDDRQIGAVLGLQGELSVRVYDFDQRRSLWYSWQDLIVETLAIRYVRDENGLVRFTTHGGGLRINDEKLEDFNVTFLGIPKSAVHRLRFDLTRLRDLCFDRFAQRLYMIRFSDPSGEEYKSIDQALFRSHKYIDPEAKRLQEVREDPGVRIEAFDSDVSLTTDDLAGPIDVRFAIRGLSGALRLKFPKISYKDLQRSPQEQTRVFYRLVDDTVETILDADYYVSQRLTVEELERSAVIPDLFPDVADTAPFREVLQRASALAEFFERLDLSAPEYLWLVHLLAIDELLGADEMLPRVAEQVASLLERDAMTGARLLQTCLERAGLSRLGGVVTEATLPTLQALPPDLRAFVEEQLLSWAVRHEDQGWDVLLDSGEICTRTLRWRTEDLTVEALPMVLAKLLFVIHDRLRTGIGDVPSDLRKYDWCVRIAKALPPNQRPGVAAIRMLAGGQVPGTLEEARRVLRQPVASYAELDDAVLAQFGLPLWPLLRAERSESGLLLTNEGIGPAVAATVRAEGGPNTPSPSALGPFDLASGKTIEVALVTPTARVDVTFEKFGTRIAFPLVVSGTPAEGAKAEAGVVSICTAVAQRRLDNARRYREQIDPIPTVVGGSLAVLLLFEAIQQVNRSGGRSHVLILGEPGVGKTLIAKLIHDSSRRAPSSFKAVNAGGGGGDLNIQRGEWIGYGPAHGIQGIPPSGTKGHLGAAHNGTLFVDEFDAMSDALQVIFLSVLENRDVERVGGESLTFDVRCLFATNIDIGRAVEEGRLRRDLVDRIAERIVVPPLRERRGDVLGLAIHFARENGVTFDDRCRLSLLGYHWPGNIRELQQVVSGAVSRATAENRTVLRAEDLVLRQATAAAPAKDPDVAQEELWRLVDRIARDEGFELGRGLQKRASEIVGVSESQASKMYEALGLSLKRTA
ncbi:MAG: sigma-54-dependent Fis family transcriptional regulator [Acidobacteria bacterium]|nr:MAG: sigma-54-dependent Fis family transcriptional regulator [Acidobacteriota bacterium]MCE7957366.1 sigma-54-dependent Fis family transcriptional regulator [Acidobacteria bacterium ACB2]